MKDPSKEVMCKYLRFHYWSNYLRQQGVLTDQEYRQMIFRIRSQCEIQ